MVMIREFVVNVESERGDSGRSRGDVVWVVGGGTRQARWRVLVVMVMVVVVGWSK
jgi:hypothetical protein